VYANSGGGVKGEVSHYRAHHFAHRAAVAVAYALAANGEPDDAYVAKSLP
jgi:hypothetical protein